MLPAERGAQFLRAFVGATRAHLSSPRIGIATSFLAAIGERIPAWDALVFVPLADIVARKIGNQYVLLVLF